MTTSQSRALWKMFFNGQATSSSQPPDIEMGALPPPPDDVQPENSPSESQNGERETIETELDSTTARSPEEIGASTSTMHGRQSSILDNVDTEPDPSLVQELIKKCKSPLQSILNFDYFFFMGPFRVNKKAVVVSNCLHKAVAIIFLGTSLMEILFAINLTSFYINDQNGSKIKRFTELMLLVSIGMNRIMYFYALWSNRHIVVNIFKGMQGPHFVQVFFDPQRWDWIRILRTVSYMWSVGICFSGMEIYRMDTLRTFGWDYADILDIHEENIIKSFSLSRYWAYQSGSYYDQTQLFNQTMQLSTFLLGHLGIAVSTAGFQIDCSIRDFFLSCVYTLYIAVLSMKMTLILAENWNQWSPEEIRPRFRHIFLSYRRLLQLAKDINQVLKPFLPFTIATDVLQLVMVAFYVLAGDWTYAISFSFNVIKTIVGIFLVFRINDEVSKIEEWFILEKTQEILDFPPNKVNTTLYEFDRFPIGIGTGATFICEAFLVTFINSVLTYFFLVAQSLEDELEALTGAAVANNTCNCTCIWENTLNFSKTF